MKKRVITVGLVLTLLSGMLTGCTIGNTQIIWNTNSVGHKHVFSINGNKCTKEEARLYLCNYQNILGQAYGIDLWEYDYSEMDEDRTLESYVKDVTLSELASIMCMEELAKKQELTLTEEELAKVEKATEEYYESLTREEISYIGLDKNELKGFYEKYAIAQKLYGNLTQGVNEEVSDDEARVMRIQQIYVKSEDVAKKVKQKLDDGEKFDSVASNYNEAASIEKNLARGEYPTEVDKVAFRLDNNEQSGMIKAKDGYYFIKCINKYDEELSEANKDTIIAKRRKEQFDDKYIELVESSQFELNENVWDSIKVDTSGKITTDSFFEIYEKYFIE